MDIMSAGAVASGTTFSNIAHGLSLTVMKKGMDAQEQQATQMIQEMLPQSIGKGEYLDVYA